MSSLFCSKHHSKTFSCSFYENVLVHELTHWILTKPSNLCTRCKRPSVEALRPVTDVHKQVRVFHFFLANFNLMCKVYWAMESFSHLLPSFSCPRALLHRDKVNCQSYFVIRTAQDYFDHNRWKRGASGWGKALILESQYEPTDNGGVPSAEGHWSCILFIGKSVTDASYAKLCWQLCVRPVLWRIKLVSWIFDSFLSLALA